MANPNRASPSVTRPSKLLNSVFVLKILDFDFDGRIERTIATCLELTQNKVDEKTVNFESCLVVKVINSFVLRIESSVVSF